MMMGSPTAKEAQKINCILKDFCDASDSSISLENSQIFFFNTPLSIQNHITRLLGFSWSSLSSNYLGVPLINNSYDSLINSLHTHLKS
jgi:hypothetical protein